jgi:hypothetical protein
VVFAELNNPVFDIPLEIRDSPALLKRHTEQETLQDHQVVGEEAESGLAVLALVRTGGQRRTQETLDHREDRLHLPALAVGLLGESPGEPAPPMTAQAARPAIVTRAAASVQRKDAAHSQALPAQAVGGFAVVTRVAQERGEGLAVVGVAHRGRELAMIGLRSAVHDQAQDQVAAGVAQGRNLWITGLIVGAVAAAAACEVVRNVPRLQPRRVDGRQAAGGRDQAEAAGFLDRGVEEPRGVVFFRSRRSA